MARSTKQTINSSLSVANAWFFRPEVQAGVILAFAFLCRGRLLSLEGLWWDDWAWAWHYYASGSLTDFLLPFKNLGHQLLGLILYLNYQLLDITPPRASHIWQIAFFLILNANSYLLWAIGRRLCSETSLVPLLTAMMYTLSPVVHIFCLTTQPYHLLLSFYLLSVLLMTDALAAPSGTRMLWILSCFFYMLSITGLESFIVLEVIRAVVINILLAPSGQSLRSRLQYTLSYWMPYLIITVSVIVYTLFIRPRSGVYQNAYAFPPLNAQGFAWVKNNIINSLHYLYSVWEYAFLRIGIPEIVRDGVRMACYLVLAALITLFLERLSRAGGLPSPRKFHLFAPMLFGLLLIMIGLLPYTITRSAVAFGLESRHGLLANIGTAIVAAAVLTLLLRAGLAGRVTFSCLLLITITGGVLFNNSIVEGYERDWRQQQQFWREFTRRVPDIKDHAFVIIDMPREQAQLFGDWRGSYEFAGALNLLYAKSTSNKDSDFDSHFAESLANGLDPQDPSAWVRHQKSPVAQYDSFKGPKSIYPQNLLVAQYLNGQVLLNKEIKNGLMVQVDLAPLTARTRPDIVVHDVSNGRFPLRPLMGLEPIPQKRQ